MSTSSPPELVAALEDLRAAWPGAAWQWDDRFDTALATVAQAREAAAREALAAALPSLWTPQTLAEAPAAVRRVCDRTGGLRGSQLVYAREWRDGVLAFCLWWPWSGGASFSARLGALAADDTPLTSAVRAGLRIG
jgi:hypothetical protein